MSCSNFHDGWTSSSHLSRYRTVFGPSDTSTGSWYRMSSTREFAMVWLPRGVLAAYSQTLFFASYLASSALSTFLSGTQLGSQFTAPRDSHSTKYPLQYQVSPNHLFSSARIALMWGFCSFLVGSSYVAVKFFFEKLRARPTSKIQSARLLMYVHALK